MKNIFHELNKPTTLINSISIGLIVGLVALVNTITYGVLIYSPTGDPASGVMLALINGLVLAFLFGAFGSVPGMVAFPQSAMTPVFAGLVASVISMMQGQSQTAITATVLASVLLASLTVGLTYLLLGYRKLGELIRFMPYPVSGGFLAGLGWILLKGGMELIIGKFSLEKFLSPDLLIFWLPALAFGIIFFFIQQKSTLTWLNPLLVIGSVVIFYLVGLRFASPDALRASGWLLNISQPNANAIFQYPLLTMLDDINWGVLILNAGNALVLIFTALISLLLNINGIEMAARQDIDPDRELRLAGIGNIFSLFAGGGIVGYPSAGLTIVAYKRGQPGRLLNFVVASLFGLALFFGLQYLSYLPNFVISGLLISLGLNFIYEWVYQGYVKFSITDYLVVLAIFFTVVFVNLLSGVGLGLVLMVIIFVVSYSKAKVIRSVLTGKTFQSNVDRPMKHAAYLKERGAQMLILRLQGYIFFGTAHSIYKQVKSRIADSEQAPVRFVVIDFSQTAGIDSSTAKVFNKLGYLSETTKFSLIFVAMSEKVLKKLTINGFDLGSANFRTFETLDYAVEWCESFILGSSDMTVITSRSLVENLGAFFEPEEFKMLFGYMQRLDVPEKHLLISQGEESPGLYLIERGRVTVYRELSNNRRLRLRTMGAGTSVGEMGLYGGGPASATVQADVQSEIYLLSQDKLKEIESQNPALAGKFHRYIIQLLGQRLQNTTASVQALME